MTDEIQWDKSPEDCPIIPVSQPNRSDLREIPLGVPTLLVNLKETGTEFSAAEWDAETRDLWISDLADEDERFPSTAMFYVNPRFLKEDANLPMRPPEEIVDELLMGWRPTGDPKVDVHQILLSAIAKAREGMTVNPF